MVKIAILRRETGASFSMDVYADGLVNGLRTVRPDWAIAELRPPERKQSKGNSVVASIIAGISKYYRRYWQYPKLAARIQADLFHIIDHSDGHLAYRLSKTGKPVVVTCHDLINFRQPQNIQDQAKLPVISTAIWKYAVRGITKADNIVTVSKHTAKDVVELLAIAPSKITPIPNGVDPAFTPFSLEIRQTIRQKYGISPDKFCILHVGSNHPRKNILTILKVIKELRDQDMPIQFVKAGADFNQTQQSFIADHQLESWITRFDRPDSSALIELYNMSDVLMSPSLYEGFGITLLEAMACGIPVITSNVTSLPEVVGSSGIMVDPLSITGLSTAVLDLMKNSEYRNELIQQGYRRVKGFTWNSTAEQVAQVYENLMLLTAESL
ncbi:MAG: glycosyltransferase family 1 protein [Phormidesmis sp.]